MRGRISIPSRLGRKLTGRRDAFYQEPMDASISIVIVNLNGKPLLADCLDALTGQDYPQDRVEIILVDNGSTDGSVMFVRETYPRVRVLEAGRNLGFAGGNNLGARAALGEYLALINNDARADSHWLRALVEPLEAEPDVACAASKILDREGRTIDFVGPAMNLYGRALQIDEGLPDIPGTYDEPRELLAPCGGAMMIRRDVFWEVGGFDGPLPNRYFELGEIVAGKKPGRRNEEERIIDFNYGLAIEDVAMAMEIYTRAKAQGVGTVLPLMEGDLP